MSARRDVEVQFAVQRYVLVARFYELSFIVYCLSFCT